ncbi:isoprenylcysteine carboxylmethyltransferase family protein [Shewanella sp. AS16]|uniref:methyltransferase family protein n=1 Tax=Shewanella sp. AS16 TaxID=2907625 RepID=UPI001F249B2B|nr:isoprenylcysteine carboxylmethyltransferase family protein [Shewanella sp. AS16]MCE9688133.1 isoprenylcysteine carboxylmethyltransferase family protein [Shewanella sp. AS16]
MTCLALKIPPLLLLLIYGALMSLGSLCTLAEIELEFGQLGLTLAASVFVCGILLATLGLYQFRAARTTVNPMLPQTSAVLVQSGVYRMSRNPMYLGFFAILLALAIYLGNWLSYLICCSFIPYMNRFQIIPEEQALFELFGEEFAQYRQSVRRWL